MPVKLETHPTQGSEHFSGERPDVAETTEVEELRRAKNQLEQAGNVLAILEQDHTPDEVDEAAAELATESERAFVSGEISAEDAEGGVDVAALEGGLGGSRSAEAVLDAPPELIERTYFKLEAVEPGSGEALLKDFQDRASHVTPETTHANPDAALESAEIARNATEGLTGDVEITDDHQEEIRENDEKLNTYLDGFAPAHEIAEYIKELPPVSEEVAVKILGKFTAIGDVASVAKVLDKFPILATEERLTNVFSHPAEMARLVAEKPAVLERMSEYTTRRGSEFVNLVQLYDGETDESRRGRIVRNVATLLNPDATDQSKNMAHSLLKLATLEDLGEIPYGEVAFSAVESYRPEQNLIGELPIPLASRLPEKARTVADIPEKSLGDMSDDEKRLCLKEEFADAHLTPEGTIDTSTASIADLRGEFQELFLAERVEASVEKSNDSAQKEAATQRNMELARSGDKFIKAGDLIHSTYVTHSEAILNNGLVCGELIGEKAEADAFPFNVDFYRIDQSTAEQNDPVRAVSSRIKENSVTFVLDRNDDSKKQYPDRTASHNNHRLILGAVPSTEIKAAVLHSVEGPQNDINFRNLTDQIVDHGVYMPVIDDEGRLLFTPEDFMARAPSSESSQRSKQSEAMNPETAYKDPTPPWDRVRAARTISI